MLALFFNDRGLSIFEGQGAAIAPEVSVHPDRGGVHGLIAVDPIAFDSEELKEDFGGIDLTVLAFYQEVPLTKWERAIRRELAECQANEQDQE